MDNFLDRRDNLIKGPYLSVALPFQRAPEGGEPFRRCRLALRRTAINVSPLIG